jgi:DNA-binding response OmpR family regulator
VNSSPFRSANSSQQQRREVQRILVVYDDSRSMVILRRILEPAGYDVTTVPIGPLTMNVFSTTKPGLVLLDASRAEQASQEFCSQIRRQSQNVPLLVLSDGRLTNDPAQVLNLGADGFIAKPFNGYELLARVRTALRHP